MTKAEITEGVLALFSVPMERSLANDDDSNIVDKLVSTSIRRAVNKYEKIEAVELSGSQYLTRAASILKCVPTSEELKRSQISVWDTIPIPEEYMGNVKHYFDPSNNLLRLWPNDAIVWVEYVVKPSLLTVTDLDPDYAEWVINYTVALLNMKEGAIGSSALLTPLPFEFNYTQLLDDGKTQKEALEAQLDEMYMGTLAIKSN